MTNLWSMKKAYNKEYSNYHTTALISHASKVMLKIFQTRLQQYLNQELSDVQAGFRKGRGTRDQIANIHWTREKAREFQKKTSISTSLTMRKTWTVSVQLLSHVRLFATPWITARQASLFITNSRSSVKSMSIELLMPTSHLILCRPLLLLSLIPPKIRVFSIESTLRMRWPK